MDPYIINPLRNGKYTDLEPEERVPYDPKEEERKTASGPKTFKKFFSTWGMPFLIFFVIFFVFHSNFAIRIGLRKFPGDVYIKRPSYTFYLPLGSTFAYTVTTLTIIGVIKYTTRKPESSPLK
ncbi:DUF2905 domain-containing protein [Candidatus Woesebacteria bacterium]|nr:DUF2905 domain-containing protein [Candidatus Woesebacteria bacterium]